MKKFDFKKVLEWLGFILKCPVCGKKYSLSNTKIIESDHDEAFGDAHIVVHSDCSSCKSSVMFNIEINGPEVFSVGMVTDLTQTDSQRLRGKQPISTNEVLGIHKEIRGFHGDFVRTFTKNV